MKIYQEKNIDVCVNGKLRMVSLNELLRLILAGKNPALAKQGHADFKKLIEIDCSNSNPRELVIAITVGSPGRIQECENVETLIHVQSPMKNQTRNMNGYQWGWG